jgi:hypothetical protein
MIMLNIGDKVNVLCTDTDKVISGTVGRVGKDLIAVDVNPRAQLLVLYKTKSNQYVGTIYTGSHAGLEFVVCDK